MVRGYAPLEQYHAHGKQGPWSDLYALGGVMYWMITGSKPVEAAARVRKDARELVEEEFSILGRLLLVPDPLVVVALIEGGVNRRPPRPVALDQPAIMRDQDTCPDAHPRIRAY